MKRILSLLFLAVLALSVVSASAFDFGYNATVVGESYGDDSFGAVELSGVFSFTNDKHIGDVELDLVLGFEAPGYRGFNATVSSPVFFHLSSFRVFPNPVLWEPKVTLGYQYRTDVGHRAMIGFSPLSFAASGFVYEFFSPYLTVDMDHHLGWGIRVMKFTAFI